MTALTTEVVARIRRMVKTTPVLVFMRGTPRQPRCHSSAMLSRLLSNISAGIRFVDIQQDPEIRAFLPKVAGVADIPLLFVNGELLGGADVAADLAEQGELERILLESMPDQRLVG